MKIKLQTHYVTDYNLIQHSNWSYIHNFIRKSHEINGEIIWVFKLKKLINRIFIKYFKEQ